MTESNLLRQIVNSFENGNSLHNIVSYVVILGTITVTFDIFMRWFWATVAPAKRHSITAYIEKTLFQKAHEVELSCYESPSFYDKYVKAMDESSSRITKVISSLYSLILKFVSLFANSLLLFFIDPWLIAFGLCPLLFGIFRELEHVKAHDLISERKPVDRRSAYVRRTFYLEEYAKEIRIGGMYKNMIRDLRSAYTDFKSLVHKHSIAKAVYGFIQRSGVEIVTILGATLYSVWSTMCIGSENGGMQIGDCLVVLSSIGTISYCLNNLVLNFAEFGEHALFLDDIRAFLEYEPSVRSGTVTASKDGGVLEFKNVSFKYDNTDTYVLKNVSFSLKKGETLALVGNNGAGKTTLIKLLLRLYDTTDGEILLNGINIKNYTLESYRELFGTVFQDFKLFSISVSDNVLLRTGTNGDADKVFFALKQSGAYQKVSTFKNGINTILTREFDDEGENLSIGEQQKISLARVFATDSPFAILDEPSSALDPIAEYNMFKNMAQATMGKSVIFISHRMSSAVLADKIILLDGGEISEYGTHDELMSKKKKYFDLFCRQAENYLGNEVVYNG